MNLSDIEFGKTRVTHTNFDSGEGTVIAEASRLYSEGTDRVSVKWDTPARHLTNISATHQVSYLEAVAPAPLDPTKVKAGDTVTLERNKARVTDTVSATDHSDMGGVGPLIRLYETGDWFRLTDVDAWTLTNHQPAPDPEPEWKPGTRGTGTINGRKVGGFISEFNSVIGFYYWNEFAGHTSYSGTVPEDFTPDVAIDPGALQHAIVTEFQVENNVKKAAAIFAKLGIEKP